MKLISKVITATIVSGALLSSAAMAADQTMKIGVVDAAKVYQEVPQGQAYADKMRNSLKPEVQELTKEQQSLQAEAQKLEKDRPSLSQSDYDKKQAELSQKMQDFQQKFLKVRQEDAQKTQQLAQQFAQTLNESVSKLGKKDGYDLIVVKQAAPYYKDQFDVTSEVIKSMESDAS